jgi:hypothetical protein
MARDGGEEGVALESQEFGGPIIQAVKELDARLEEVEQRLDRLDAQS